MKKSESNNQRENEVISSNEGEQVLLTRSQTARRMGVSISTVRRMEGAELQPIMIDGRHLFHLTDIDRVRPITDGQVASRAFEGFNSGKSIIEMVIELEQSPETISKLHASWVELSRSVVIQGYSSSYRQLEEWFPKLGKLNSFTLRQCLYVVHEYPENIKRLKESYSAEHMNRFWETRQISNR